MEGVDVIYWINLDRSVERRRHMMNQLKDNAFEGIPQIRIPAIDSRGLDLKKMANRTYDILTTNATVSIKEYACLLSHLKAIHAFIKSTHDIALIFEDDMSLALKSCWKQSIADMLKTAPKDWETIKIHSPIVRDKLFTLSEYKNGTMGDMYTWSALAYIIKRSAAVKLIRKIYDGKKYNLTNNNYVHRVDYFIDMILKTYIYKYPYFTTRASNDTNIQTHTSHANNFRFKCKSKKLTYAYKKTNQLFRTKKVKSQTHKTRGGSYYYPYNKNPLLFTETTRGGWGGDPRSTLLPTPLVNAGRSMMDGIRSSISTTNGAYPSISSSVLVQPINKI